MHSSTSQKKTDRQRKEPLSKRYFSGEICSARIGLRAVKAQPTPGLASREEALDTIQQLIVLITQTVEPDSWEVNDKGGLGTISFYAPTMALVVKQFVEVHYLLSLDGGRLR